MEKIRPKGDVTGKRFGRLVAISEVGCVERNGTRFPVWLCQCDCGNTIEIKLAYLRNGTKSCGCLANEGRRKRNFKDITGKRFGKLVAVSHRFENGDAIWKCKCDCGSIIEVVSSDLNRGRKTSCGCWTHELISNAMRKHGLCKTRIWRIWTGMKTRCYNKNDKAYKNYGGRGIAICDEWKEDLTAFSDWAMKNGYRDDLTIERIDVDGNYSPENCKWITLAEQEQNRRNTIFLEYKGEKLRINEWAERYGIDPLILRARLYKGKGIGEALETPVIPRGKKRKNE